jgi:hypothetical protein
VAIALPFSITTLGNVTATTDYKAIWAGKVLSVVGTAINERVMRVGFGTEIVETLFQNQDVVQENLDREIRKSFSSYLPDLVFVESKATLDETSNTFEVEIMYTLPDLTQDVLVVGSIEMSGNSIINEVIL